MVMVRPKTMPQVQRSLTLSSYFSCVLVGMVAGTAVLHGLGLAAGLALRSHSVWWPRLAGAALALWGGVMLAQLA